MSMLQAIERKGTAAVKRLRSKKLLSGLPFMINSTDLPSGQCYLEYPDGSIQLVVLKKNSRDFDVIHDLSSHECNELRAKFNLSNQ